MDGDARVAPTRGLSAGHDRRDGRRARRAPPTSARSASTFGSGRAPARCTHVIVDRRDAGDDAAAKAEIAALIERLGFFGVDMGDIETGSRTFQSPGGPLIAHNLVKIG